LQTCINKDTFDSELKTMTTATKNTIYSLLCLASLVLAAPIQSTQYSKEAKKNQLVPGVKMSFLSQSQCVAVYLPAEPVPSVMDGTARFSCW
jgi:hypothetical protein